MMWVFTQLTISGNSLTSISAGVFAGLSSLTELDLSGNEIEVIAENAFQDLSSVTSFSEFNSLFYIC